MNANTARVLLQTQAVLRREPVQVLSALNRSLHHEFQIKQFLTLGYLLLDTHTATLTYASAGHEPFVLIRPHAEEYRLLKSKGYPFSTLHAELFEQRITQENYSLQQGDMVFCYTDGATDVVNEQGEMFGEIRLYSLVQRLRGLPTQTILDHVYQALQSFQGHAEQTDDITMFILKRL